MGSLDQDEIDEIRESYKETGSIPRTAQEIGRAKDTVQKYTADMREDDDEGDEPEQTTDTDKPEGWTGTPPDQTPFSSRPGGGLPDGDSDRVDYANMGPGEFIQHFFEELDIGVKENFAVMLARLCETRGRIPNPDGLKMMIQNHGSGVGNANDAQLIAEIYGDISERYLNERGQGNNQMQSYSGSQPWKDPNAQQHHPQNGQPEQQNTGQYGGWSDVPTPGPAQQPNQPMGQQPPGMGGFGGQQPAPQQQGGMYQLFERMMDEMRQERQQLMEHLNQQNQDQQGQQQDDPLERFREMMEMKELIDQLQGEDGESDQFEQLFGHLQQELQQVRAQIDSGGSSSDVQSGDPRVDALISLVGNEDVDPDRLEMISEHLGMSADPEIKKMEIEKEMAEKKSEHRKQLVDQVLDGGGELLEGLVESGITAAVGPGSTEETEPEPELRTREAEPAAEAQQVEREVEPQPQDEQVGSPMRQKHVGDQPADEPEVESEQPTETETDDAPAEPEPEEPIVEIDTYDLGYALHEEHGYTSGDYNTFLSDMRENGIDRELATETWRDLRDGGVITSPEKSGETPTPAATDGGNEQ